MTVPFVTRNPTDKEIEKFRLILSTYQDGSGMLKRKDRTLPGWRDFERSIRPIRVYQCSSVAIYKSVIHARLGTISDENRTRMTLKGLIFADFICVYPRSSVAIFRLGEG